MDDTVKINCYVIAAPDSKNVANLIQTLQRHQGVSVVRMDATMVHAESSEFLELDEDSLAIFKKIYGRTLLPGEVGCSLSHNRARFLASQNPLGALIIEEDAIIQDLNLLISTTTDFLKARQNQIGVLSFYNNEIQFSRDRQPLFSRRWVQSIGAPSSTVAYAITNKSADRLVRSNNPIRFLADWPITKNTFFIASMNVVSHPDDPLASQIGSRSGRENGFKLKDRIEILTFTHYFAKKDLFSSFSEFFVLLWLPRFKFQLNRARFYLYFRTGILK